MNRYSADAYRAHIQLRAKDPNEAASRAAALLRVRPSEVRIRAIDETTPSSGDNPQQMSKKDVKKVKAATKKAPTVKPAKKTLGDRVVKAATKKANPAADKPDKPLSGLSAAVFVLRQSGKPMSAKDIIEAMKEAGLGGGLKGLTPHATIYAAMITEIAKKGDKSRFARGEEKGTFIATKASDEA